MAQGYISPNKQEKKVVQDPGSHFHLASVDTKALSKDMLCPLFTSIGYGEENFPLMPQ